VRRANGGTEAAEATEAYCSYTVGLGLRSAAY